MEGIYAGQPGRKTARPARSCCWGDETISVSVVEVNGQTYSLLSPLTDVQKRLLELWGLPSDLYETVARGFQNNPQIRANRRFHGRDWHDRRPGLRANDLNTARTRSGQPLVLSVQLLPSPFILPAQSFFVVRRDKAQRPSGCNSHPAKFDRSSRKLSERRWR